MKKSGMDLSKFKHVKSDDKTTTLQHADGHTLTIAHGKLSKDMQAQLSALSNIAKDTATPLQQGNAYADGGVIEEASRSGLLGSQRKVSQEISDEKSGRAKAQTVDPTKGDVRTEEQKATAAEYDKTGILPDYKAKGGRVKMAEGGDLLQEDPNAPPALNSIAKVEIPKGEAPPDLTRAQELYNQLVQTPFEAGQTDFRSMPSGKEPLRPGSNPASFDPQAWQQARKIEATEQSENAAKTAAAQQNIIAENQARVDAGLPPLPVPNVPTGPQPPGIEADQNQPQPQPADIAAASQQDTMGMGQQQDMLSAGYSNQIQGIQQQASAQAELGKQQADVLAQAQQAQTEAKAAYQKHFDELDQERKALVQDVQDGQVNPEKFWDNHSKMASAIGMIIAGFNPTNSPNAAMQYLDKQMEMNLDAQKTNLATKRSLLSANLQQFGNLKDATEMTRIQQADLVTNQLQQAAAKASSPLAKAAALQAAGQIQEKYAPLFQQFAMRRAMMGLAQGGNSQSVEHMLQYMRVVNPEMAKEMEGRYVPGVGLATIPVPADIRQKITDHEDMTAAIKDLQRFVNTHSTIVPGTPDYNVGQQKALVLQSAVREGKLGTVYREGEQPLLDKFVNSNPAGAMKMLKTIPQLKELLSSNERSGNILKKQYGLPVHNAVADQRAQAKAWAKANPKDPRAIKIIKALGR
jgi:hypothetical protein